MKELANSGWLHSIYTMISEYSNYGPVNKAISVCHLIMFGTCLGYTIVFVTLYSFRFIECLMHTHMIMCRSDMKLTCSCDFHDTWVAIYDLF